jgi:hypothetical protein
MMAWLEEAARVDVIASVHDFCAAMNKHAMRSTVDSCSAVFINFTPQPKASMPRKFLSSARLRKERIAIKTTYAWRFSCDAGSRGYCQCDFDLPCHRHLDFLLCIATHPRLATYTFWRTFFTLIPLGILV